MQAEDFASRNKLHSETPSWHCQGAQRLWFELGGRLHRPALSLCYTSSVVTCPVILTITAMNVFLATPWQKRFQERNKQAKENDIETKERRNGKWIHMHIKYAQRRDEFTRWCWGSIAESRLTYLLTSATFDRGYSALQIINQYRSIIIEARRRAEIIAGRHAILNLWNGN